MYKALDDGSIVKTVTNEEAQQRIADLQAQIDGAKTSIVSYTASKQAEIDEYQAELDVLQPVVTEAVSVAESLAAVP